MGVMSNSIEDPDYLVRWIMLCLIQLKNRTSNMTKVI